MRSTRLHPRRTAGASVLAGMLALIAGCASSPPGSGSEPLAQDDAAPAADCARLGNEIAQAEQARHVAPERSDNAWQAVVPVAVVALEASGTAAVHDADRKLLALKVRARPCASSSTTDVEFINSASGVR